MHSIIIPALAKILIALFLNTLLNGKLEKKIIGDEWIITADAMQKENEYHLFLELKSNKQSLPFCKYRTDSLSFWNTAYKQICGIEREIKLNKNFYKNRLFVFVWKQ